MKKIVIVGGEFNNKGAQAMVFVAISEIKKRFPECKINILSFVKIKKEEAVLYRANIYTESFDAQRYVCNKNERGYLLLKHFIKKIVGKKPTSILNTEKAYKDVDAVIDISGYLLSSQWGIEVSDYYLRRIEIAKKYKIPYYIMPQSIGPFDYQGSQALKITEKIKKLLSYPQIIYVREKEGYNLLKSYGLKNVKKSVDLVLQNKEICLTNIYSDKPKFKYMEVCSKSVGILPNMRNFDHGNKEQIIKLYKMIIKDLLQKNRKVYLMQHAGEDAEACQIIKMLFKDNEEVVVLKEEFNCIEYQMLVKQFDFLIASRYHSIIHAYKEGVPCVALGWAVKYKELLTLFDQSSYVFDVRYLKDLSGILNAVEQLNKNHVAESEKIKEKLVEIQKENCFDVLENIK